MKKTKHITLIIIGLVLFLPFVTFSSAQESYVGIQDGDDYAWRLGLHISNWQKYFDDRLEGTLGNLMPLGASSNLTRVFIDWFGLKYTPPPQTIWPFNVTAVGPEETGTPLFPFDNTTITFTPVSATAGWEYRTNSGINSYFNGIWYIVNDTSSFLRQTLNLTLSFSPYGMMSIPLAPITINWTSLITEFLGVMNSKGGLYKNISATARSNGFLIHVPALGFEDNFVAIDIDVKYDANGVLDYYRFIYGGKLLIDFGFPQPSTVIISLSDILTIFWGGVFILAVVLIIIMLKKYLKQPIYVGGI